MSYQIKNYSFELPDGSVKSGKTITYYDGETEITTEEYLGFTAEEWLNLVGFGGNRQPTLLYLRQAGAISEKLNATEQYLNTILAKFAMNPEPQNDWPEPPYSFEEVVGESVSSLQSN